MNRTARASGPFTIGQLARVVGVPTSTVRFYERSGLLRPRSRTGSNYRQYDADSLHRLRFIRAAQSTGLSLHDIAELLALDQSARAPCEAVQRLLHARLDQTRARIRDLRHVERVLSGAIRSCSRGQRAGICAVIETLKNF